jgi:predicted peroxiredoxin
LSTIEWMESNNTKSVPEMIDDIIKNGIKKTKKLEHDRTTYHGHFSQEHGTHTPLDMVQDVIKNGVKETELHKGVRPSAVEDTIQNGVKNTYSDFVPQEYDWSDQFDVEKVIENGIKETRAMDEWVNTNNIVDKVMVSGIKEVQPLPAQDGNRDWGIYYYRKGEPTKPHTEYVMDVIESGEKIQ